MFGNGELYRKLGPERSEAGNLGMAYSGELQNPKLFRQVLAPYLKPLKHCLVY